MISREFGEVGFLLECIHSLITPDAQILAMKNVHPHSETKQIKALFCLVNIHETKVPHIENKRHVMEVGLVAA